MVSFQHFWEFQKNAPLWKAVVTRPLNLQKTMGHQWKDNIAIFHLMPINSVPCVTTGLVHRVARKNWPSLKQNFCFAGSSRFISTLVQWTTLWQWAHTWTMRWWGSGRTYSSKTSFVTCFFFVAADISLRMSEVTALHLALPLVTLKKIRFVNFF